MTRQKTPDPDADRRDDDAGAHDEGALFRRLMADAKRLENDRAPPHVGARSAGDRRGIARTAGSHRVFPTATATATATALSEAATADHLEFRRGSVGRGVFRRLARGGFRRQAELDLHGLTTAEASEALGEFVAECVEHGLTCVRIIHGKGRGSGEAGPVLKRLADQWLRHCREVRAFVTARPADGGSGALYVLLVS